MYNLLVSGAAWPEGATEFPISRIFEGTQPLITQGFQTPSGPDFQRMIDYPALFVRETRHDEELFARVGRIVSVRPHGRYDVTIEYFFEQAIAPIPHCQIVTAARSLGIELPQRGLTELERTHWAMKDVDLFKVLLTQTRPVIRQPSVFNLRQPSIVDPNLLSAMMPFAGFGPVHHAIIRAAELEGMRCNRADDIWENATIIQDVVDLIDRSAIVLCDCTGRNANVFYEMGIAHTLGKEVILITQSPHDIPFDVQHLRHIRYLNNGEGLDALTREIAARIRGIRNPRPLQAL